MKNMNVCVVLLFLASCGSPESSLLVDDGNYEERLDERARRMALTVIDENGQAGESSAAAVAAFARQHCALNLPPAWQQMKDHAEPCNVDVYSEVFIDDCAAQTLLDAASAETPSQILRIVGINPLNSAPIYEPITLPPQLPEARIALARESANLARSALLAAGDTLRYHAGQNLGPDGGSLAARVSACDRAQAGISPTSLQLGNSDLRDALTVPGIHGDNDDDGNPSNDQITPLALIAEVLAGSTSTMERAARIETQHQLAVAEAERSRSSSTTTAARLAWTDPLMSRASIAKHLLGGSTEGLFGFDDDEGVCPLEPPTGDVDAARRFLASTGVDPALLFDLDLGLDALAMGGGSVGAGESLAERFSELGGTGDTFTSTTDLLATAGVSEDAVRDARRYMRAEARAFALQPLQIEGGIVQSPELVGGVPTERNFAAWTTMRRATAPPLMYFVGASVMSDVVTIPSDGVAWYNPISANYGARSIAHAVDYATAVAVDFAGFAAGAEPATTYLALPDDARARLRPLMDTAKERVPARIQFCQYIVDSQAYMDVHVLVRDEDLMNVPSDLIVVQGVSGLRCAEQGNVQGEDCDLANYQVGVADIGTNAVERDTGMRDGFSAFFPIPDFAAVPGELPQQAADHEFLYVLHRAADVAGPGAYRSLGSHRLGASGNYCVMSPFVPEYIALAGAALKPSTDNCGTTEQTCAGPSYADRIPLENEITGNDGGQGLEDSWQYWLALAESSAELADRLGEGLLTSGEVLDEGLEQAEDALSALCGGPVNLADLFFEINSRGAGGLCGPGNACPAEYECSSGNCVVDIDELLERDEFSVLKGCIGEDSIVPYVGAGTRHLCVWTLPGDTSICGVPVVDGVPAPIAHGCPWLADGTDNPTCTTPPGLMATDVHHTTELLRLFETDDPGPQDPPPEGPFDCNIIRRMRATNAGDRRTALARQVAASPDFSLDNMSAFVNRMGYRALPDDYGQITKDGVFWRGLGRPWAPISEVAEWPCGTAGVVCLDYHGGSQAELFCSTAGGSCGGSGETDENRADRAYMNHRLARAVLALKLLTGNDAGAVELPYRPRPLWLSTEADGTTGVNERGPWQWDLVDRGPPRPLAGGRSVITSGSIDFYIEEADGYPVENDKTTIPFAGRAYCRSAGVGTAWLWTHFPTIERTDSSRIHMPCEHEGIPFDSMDGYEGNPPSVTQGVVFRPITGTTNGTVIDVLDRLWRGMGPSGPIPDTEPVDDYDSPLARLLLSGEPGILVRKPDCNWDLGAEGGWRCESSPVTSYWNAMDGTNAYNDLRLLDDGIRDRDFLDGLELACEMMADEHENPSVFNPSACGDWDSLLESSQSNMRQAERLMNCLAHEIDKRGEMQIFSDVPQAALDAIRNTRTIAGSRGADLHTIATQVNALTRFPVAIADLLRETGSLMRRARIATQRSEIRQDINSNERQSTQFRETTSCISGMLRASAQAVGGPNTVGGAIAGPLYVAAGIVDCVNSVAQITFAHIREDLQNELAMVDEDSELNAISSQLGAALTQMRQINTEAQNAQNDLRGALSRIEVQRVGAMNTLTDALVTNGSTSAVSTLRRRRFNTGAERYEEAHERAIRTAWLARRALEQRLGRNLSNMTDELPLVEAPRSWADELCVMGGMDYQAITRDYELPGGDSYAQEYVGDYVRRLRSVFDSYSVAHPFVTGDDVAVVSMRDDVVHAHRVCEVPVRNLLAYSGELATALDPDFVSEPAENEQDSNRTAPPMWRHEGCVPDAAGDINSCIGLERVEENAVPPSPEHAGTTGWRIQFGGAAGTSYVAGTHIAQRAALPAGSYRLSWRGKMADVDPRMAVTVHNDLGAEIAGLKRMDEAYPTDAWDGYYLYFSMPEEGEVDIVIQPTGTTGTGPFFVEVGALMLENVSREIGGSIDSIMQGNQVYPPLSYIETKAAGIASLAVCEDTTGTVFQTHWRRDCTRLCPGGGEGCPTGRLACYWEMPFNISQYDLEHGGQLARAGFANGNYNYRWNTISANIVGTNVRDCENSEAPSTCYGSGYVPISIYHDTGFEVRNGWGELYDAPLFPGRIEHARALNAERYLTNPLSSADRALVEPYTRYEMRGRPLAGRYRIRIWDEPGIRFDQVEDVQLVLAYRYWTSLN